MELHVASPAAHQGRLLPPGGPGGEPLDGVPLAEKEYHDASSRNRGREYTGVQYRYHRGDERGRERRLQQGFIRRLEPLPERTAYHMAHLYEGRDANISACRRYFGRKPIMIPCEKP